MALVKTNRWVEEDFSLCLNGIYIIQAGQGSGKTEAIKRVEKRSYALAATLILIRPENPLPSLTTT